MFQGLTFRKNSWSQVAPKWFRFSCQQKYFSEKHGKLVASEKNVVALATPAVATSSSVFPGKECV